MDTRGRDGSERGISHELRLLVDALPFRLVRRERDVVGCWFTNRPLAHAGKSEAEVELGVFWHGMVRTADGRVAGVSEHVPHRPDLGDVMLRKLSDASRRTLPNGRRSAAGDFVTAIRDASEATDTAWTPDRERHALQELRYLDGYRGWEVDADRNAALAAIKALTAARRRVLSRFLGTLDQDLLRVLRPLGWDAEHSDEHDALLGDAWPLLDHTFGRGAAMRPHVMPVIDDFYAVQDLLHPLVAWSTDRKDIDDLYREEQRLDRVRRFMPAEPSDLSDLPVPGLG